MRLPPLNAVRVFEVFSRTLSVRQSADVLNVSQSAVSQQLRHLETQLARRLIDRDGRQMRLTEEGELLARVSQHMMSTLATVVEEISQSRAPKTLMISAPPSFTVKWLIPKLELFRRHSTLAISIDANAALVDFESAAFDGAIRFSASAPSDLEYVELVRPEIVAVAAPAFLATNGLLDKLTDAANFPLIHCRPPSRRHAALHVSWDEVISPTEGRTSSHNLILSEDHMALSAAAHGQGLALAERILVERELANGSLVVVCRETLRARGTYRFVWPRGASRSSHRQTFLDFICAELKEHVAAEYNGQAAIRTAQAERATDDGVGG